MKAQMGYFLQCHACDPCVCVHSTEQRKPMASQQQTAQDRTNRLLRLRLMNTILLLLHLKFFKSIKIGHFHHLFFKSSIGILSKPDSFCKQMCLWRCDWQTYFFRRNILPENVSGSLNIQHHIKFE